MALIATIADLCSVIPNLWENRISQFGSNTGAILDKLNIAASAVKAALVPYYGSDLKLATPEFTNPIKLTLNEDFSQSWGVSLDLITPHTANQTETEHIIVTATDLTKFSVTGYLSRSLGTGDTEEDFTASDSSFKILASSWVKNETEQFVVGDKFIFSRTWYEPLLRYLTSVLAAHYVTMSRYMAEGANELDFGKNKYLSEYTNIKKLLIDPNSPESLSAPNAVYSPQNLLTQETWQQGYDVDRFGIESDEYE